MDKKRPIGIFDSGVGGLTVVSETRKILPDENIIYLGDTARVPYGAKSRETLIGYGRDIMRFLLGKNVKAIIAACGTVSSNAYDVLTAEFDIPLIDVIRPGVKACLDINAERIGFIATEATVRSGVFVNLIREKKPGADIQARACPLFVPLAEEGFADSVVTRLVADIYIADWKNKIDTLVLGCTHYPLLIPALRDIVGGVTFINMAEYTARAARALLSENGLLNDQKTEPAYTFYVSGASDKFDRMVKTVMGRAYPAEKVDL
ncbi:MAG: glutamate racemase [Clostridiales bacterium]|jgi:glutamate racemase|nr:glutamate racemase [Clostridiales bacterium]